MEYFLEVVVAMHFVTIARHSFDSYIFNILIGFHNKLLKFLELLKLFISFEFDDSFFLKYLKCCSSRSEWMNVVFPFDQRSTAFADIMQQSSPLEDVFFLFI